MKRINEPERIETIVIGGGQAGLATGYHLRQQGLDDFVILDGSRRIGESWRKRWDSLRLFTPARLNGLPGMAFPGPGDVFPTKDEMADYLEAYVEHFNLPVQLGVRVNRLAKNGDRFLVKAGERTLEADNVVVAMTSYQVPWVPPFARELDPAIVQMHSAEYRNPAQLQDGSVLVVGAGNSGAEIGMEVAKDRPTWLSGRDVGHVPFRIETSVAYHFLIPLVLRFLFHRVFTVDTPIGRKIRPKLRSQGGLLVRTKPEDLDAMGIKRVGKIVGVKNGLPLVEGGRVLEVANVIWCTGFRPDFSWIDLPIFSGKGKLREPRHERGIVAEEPGLSFVGLFFLYALSSSLVNGVGRDAKYVAEHVAERTKHAANHPAAQPQDAWSSAPGPKMGEKQPQSS